MKKSIFGIMASVVLIMVSVCGCSDKNKVGDITVSAGESAIYMEEDGAVSYAICESFDKEYYDKGDLKKLIEEEVDEFNVGPYASTTDAADFDSFQVKDDVATAIITFDTIDNFVSYIRNYNGKSEKEMFIGTISEAQDKGIKIVGDFTEVKDGASGEETVKGKAIRELDSNIIVVSDKVLVQLENKEIQYTSANCTVKDGIVTVNDDEKAYIIYQ